MVPTRFGNSCWLGLRSIRHRRVQPQVHGWKVSTSLHTDIALDALEMAFRDRSDCQGVVHHSDRGVQYLSIRYSERLAKAQATASVGTKGDSYDNALMESHNGLYKWELINRRDDWRDADHVEWETLCYIDWFNNRRLHGANGMVPHQNSRVRITLSSTPQQRCWFPKQTSLYKTRGDSLLIYAQVFDHWLEADAVFH